MVTRVVKDSCITSPAIAELSWSAKSASLSGDLFKSRTVLAKMEVIADILTVPKKLQISVYAVNSSSFGRALNWPSRLSSPTYFPFL